MDTTKVDDPLFPADPELTRKYKDQRGDTEQIVLTRR